MTRPAQRPTCTVWNFNGNVTFVDLIDWISEQINLVMPDGRHLSAALVAAKLADETYEDELELEDALADIVRYDQDIYEP